MRHAIAALVRRAMSDDLSAQLNYRYYTDSWGLGSHTIAAQLDWFAAEDTLVSLRYRFYSQGKVDFYQSVYAVGYDGNSTRDRELSSMSDHRIGVDVDQRFDLGDDEPELVLAGGLGGDFYSYDEFIGLDSVTALEITIAVGLEK